jgi:hypothetical protein
MIKWARYQDWLVKLKCGPKHKLTQFAYNAKSRIVFVSILNQLNQTPKCPFKEATYIFLSVLVVELCSHVRKWLPTLVDIPLLLLPSSNNRSRKWAKCTDFLGSFMGPCLTPEIRKFPENRDVWNEFKLHIFLFRHISLLHGEITLTFIWKDWFIMALMATFTSKKNIKTLRRLLQVT